LPQLEDAIRQALRVLPSSAITSLGAFDAEVCAQPITERDGTVKGITLIGYDISDTVRNERTLATNRKLRAAVKDRMRFVNTVSHDLRNPLQSIISYTEILALSASEQLTPRQARVLSIIQNNAEQLNSLIDDLFILDTGNYSLKLSPVDVGKLMRQIVDAQLPIFESAGQTLTLSLPEYDYTVEADQLRLTRVVTNLLSNASKYSPTNALTELGVEATGSELKLSVTDNGPGIPEEIRDRVFDPGTRGPNAKVSGSGLGLYITSKIVELHGGTVSIESQEGAGTTVNVILPRAQRTDAATHVAELPETEHIKHAAIRAKRRRRES
jgi:signal transduction histidine kinase